MNKKKSKSKINIKTEVTREEELNNEKDWLQNQEIILKREIDYLNTKIARNTDPDRIIELEKHLAKSKKEYEAEQRAIIEIQTRIRNKEKQIKHIKSMSPGTEQYKMMVYHKLKQIDNIARELLKENLKTKLFQEQYNTETNCNEQREIRIQNLTNEINVLKSTKIEVQKKFSHDDPLYSRLLLNSEYIRLTKLYDGELRTNAKKKSVFTKEISMLKKYLYEYKKFKLQCRLKQKKIEKYNNSNASTLSLINSTSFLKQMKHTRSKTKNELNINKLNKSIT